MKIALTYNLKPARLAGENAALDDTYAEWDALPGILPHAESHSCFPQAAAAAGIAYPDLIRQVLHLACQRYGLRG